MNVDRYRHARAGGHPAKTKTAAKLPTLLDPRRLSVAMQRRGDDIGGMPP